MGFKKINSLKVSLFTHLVVALVFSIIFSFAVQNIAGHMKETIWLEYIDADELYEFQNKYSSQFGGMISVPQVMNSEMDKVDQFWVGVCEFMESWSVFILTFTSVYIALTIFYNRRLKKPLHILNSCAEKEAERSEWKIMEHMHEPLVTQEVFDKVQEINKVSQKKYRESHKNTKPYENIYREIIKCGDCGAAMHLGKYVSQKTGIETRVFRCGKYRETNRRECSIHTIKETVLHDAVLAQIKLQIQVMADMAQKVKCGSNDGGIGSVYESSRSRIAELTKRKTRVSRLREGLYENFCEGILNETEYREMREDYLEQENVLQNEIEKAMGHKMQIDTFLSKTEETAAVFKKFSRKKKLDRTMLEALVQEIRVFEDNHIEVVFKFTDTCQSFWKEMEEDGE